MMRKKLGLLAIGATSAVVLVACAGGRAPARDIPTSAPSISSGGAAGVPNSGAPQVQNPLPDKVLAGSPCNSALTASQISDYLGTSRAPKSTDSTLGPQCDWGNVDTGVVLNVVFQTKSDQGISLPYESVRSRAKRWVVLDPIEGYPAIGYVTNYIEPEHPKKTCVVVVGVSDKLAYSVSLGLGDRGVEEGDDACQLGRTVAGGVLTNLKARA